MAPLDRLRRRWAAEAARAGRTAEATALGFTDEDVDAQEAREALEQLRREPDEPEHPWRAAA
jgi:hypothetical protein